MKTLFGMSAGKINLNTGKTKYFNVLENNRPEDSLVLIQNSTREPSFTVVAGSGQGYDEFLNGTVEMKSQGKTIKFGVGIKEVRNTKEGMNEIKEIIGSNKCSFWVFK